MAERLSPFALMEKLISFPTVSRDTNIPLIDWVADYLDSHGIESHRYVDPEEPKHALFAHVGPWEEGAIVLSGHTDVVPVDGQPWDTDPFSVVEKDGKYYGRGTCDMKGFDALALWALVEGKYMGLKRPLQIALSFDEEIGCTGAPPMIEAMQPVLPKGSAVIVGEPSTMQAVTGHKGGTGFDTHVVGFEVHSSLMHTGVNAIMAGAKLIEWANEMNTQSMAQKPSAIAAMFDPPFTTTHVGMIEGGTAHNITAKDCKFAMDFRVVPGEDKDAWGTAYLKKVREVEAQMQAVVPETYIEVTPRFDVPGLKPEDNGEAETLVRQITGDNASHKVSYGTEAGQFQDAGYSAVICGPGDIAQAHQPNEFIEISQFNAGHDFMKSLLSRLAS
ncbi:acetylornithine deacetylase [Sulfitobacter mediterraneus]|jgi:acetylornithine deacetylase|uniref:Acetylornithine deacetylase n=1 Tax=Sulfitobacter mediterraneus TaxID=83219 RepID=A0A2T6CI79_9RHOB|nr:acetylornithine deacetylase [Sulfitobacter mediterraneus]KIN76620.1 Acetylornithine deacetylase (ArgE) [Sulfitobacter mediterraneus KCTC 32188]MBM1309325.1 acetylornithine deacetylase [Sulfitobacter mediterraneus]MBM1313210.1 acetylornithine deacetylase [Sulfitobacter mediterraneus]MBM1321594.1 acetylornithine deacetylase [Sulfitobacter mediterraneus]MBM1325481.1 acetylornithine deacetylase [Sulfitobacter mediterraneus]